MLTFVWILLHDFRLKTFTLTFLHDLDHQTINVQITLPLQNGIIWNCRVVYISIPIRRDGHSLDDDLRTENVISLTHTDTF